MNRSWVSKFAGLVLVLTLITSSLVAGTYAKYVTEVKATDNVTVANWSAKLEDDGTTNTTYTTTFDFMGTMSDTGVKEKLLAPGTQGSFALDFDMTGTEVAHNVTIEMDASALLTNLPFLKFFKDSVGGEEIAKTTPSAILLYTDDFGTTGTTGSAIVYWQWPFDNSNDEDDTEDGITATTAAITVNFTATQRDTYTAP